MLLALSEPLVHNYHYNAMLRRILAADDDPDVTFIVKAGPEASGLFEVHTFNDPEVALSSFKPELYDLALIDFRMPKMYGKKRRKDPSRLGNATRKA